MAESNKTKQLLELLRAGSAHQKKKIDPSQIKYAIYARKSSTDEDAQAHSIEDQVQDLMEGIVEKDKLNVVQIYRESFSAKESDTREQFKLLVNDIKTGRINGVLSWHPDRLARNMKDAGEIIDLVDRESIADLRFHTFTFENTAEGKMTLGITFVLAKQYSEHLSDNVNRGNKKTVTERGEFIGKFKHGYILDANRYFQPDPDGFTKIQHMFKIVLGGQSQKAALEWIQKQDYKVQKKFGDNPVSHNWTKDNISKMMKDPHYAGVHEWGRNYVMLSDFYDFTPVITVDEYQQLNDLDSLDIQKISAIHRPKGETKAKLLKQMVYCGVCNHTMTSMMLPGPKDEEGNPKHYRYYWRCETLGCDMYDKSARAKFVIDTAHSFFNKYLFITETNFEKYMVSAKAALKQKNRQLESEIASQTSRLGKKERAYESTKELLLRDGSLGEHYDLGKQKAEIEGIKTELQRLVRFKQSSKEILPQYENYLKLLETTPVILNKIHSQETMDKLLRIFFLNFTITPTEKDFRRGSKVTYKLNEPWEGFVKSNDFVPGGVLQRSSNLF